MAIIALEGMEFHAFHGVFPKEKKNGNTFLVDVKIDTGDDPLTDSDELSSTIDYGMVFDITKMIMNNPVDLLETLVNKIGNRILKAFPGIYSVHVRVSKLNPPVDGKCYRSFVEDTFK